jgi:L-lactate dehydrogenase complex protein LldF
MKAASWTFADHRRLEAAGKVAAATGKVLRSKRMGGKEVLHSLPWPASVWSGARDVPVPPTESFRDWWQRTDGGRQDGAS